MVTVSWNELLVTGMSLSKFEFYGWLAYKRGERVPSPKGKHETHPREEEGTAIWVDRVEDRDGASLPIDRIHIGSPPQIRDFEPHCIRFPTWSDCRLCLI
jgi:hypothetical protein